MFTSHKTKDVITVVCLFVYRHVRSNKIDIWVEQTKKSKGFKVHKQFPCFSKKKSIYFFRMVNKVMKVKKNFMGSSRQKSMCHRVPKNKHFQTW